MDFLDEAARLFSNGSFRAIVRSQLTGLDAPSSSSEWSIERL